MLSLADGAVVALGAPLALDGRVSWYPRAWRGWTSANAYVLLEPDGALLVDTGLSVHAPAILAQLEQALGARRSLSLLLTRVVEPDGVCNAGRIMRRLTVERIFASQVPRLFVHFQTDCDEEPHTADGPAWARALAVPEVILGHGTRISVGSATDRVEVISPALRLLGTSWLYDHSTGTLFTSDSFGHCIGDAPTGPRLAAEEVTLERARAYQRAKLDWLDRAEDTRVIRQRLQAQLEPLDIVRIAPQYGAIIEGRGLVARHVAAVLDAVWSQEVAA